MKNGAMHVDKEKLRYGLEIMCAALGRARKLSLDFAEGTNEGPWRQIDKELQDLIVMMEKHDWDVLKLFETAVNPEISWNGVPFQRKPNVERIIDWKKTAEEAYKEFEPRPYYARYLALNGEGSGMG